VDYRPYLDESSERAATHRLVDLGSVHLPTGRVVCADPSLLHETAALDRAAPIGDFPVRLCVTPLPDWGERVALAAVVFTRDPIERWVTASCAGGTQDAFRVDSGLAAFLDESTVGLFTDAVARHNSCGAGRNYYDDVLAEEFARSADPARGSRTGDWNVHTPRSGDPRNIVMFASGLGDGVYSASWALGRRGEPVMLVADFALLT
jgi:Protein of unknown function (DUF4241)